MRIVILLLTLLAPLNAGAAGLLLGDAQRGKAIHDQKCISCHTGQFGGDGSGIYTRADRKVKTIEGLQAQVERCGGIPGIDVSPGDINDLVKYLAESHYQFPGDGND